MILPATWRRIGLVLELASITCVVFVVLGVAWITLRYRPDPDVIDDLGPWIAWVFVGPLVPVVIVGIVGLVRWWQSGRDTPIIAYGVFAILVVAPLVPSAFAASAEVASDPRAVVAMLAPTLFVLVTGAATFAVYRSRGASSSASQLP